MKATKIEWCDYSLNPVKGLCPMACKNNEGKEYCYARAMYKRFKWNPEIRFKNVFNLPQNPARFFVGSTMELFGDWIKPEWMQSIFADVRYYPQHTFIFLTKQPQNLIKWSPFPDNCWIGATVTNEGRTYPDMFKEACRALGLIKAPVRYISFEPLQSSIYELDLLEIWGINWLIIGQQTPISARTSPRREWIDEIARAGMCAGVPIFLKNNLLPLYKELYHSDNVSLKQEFPIT